MFWCVPDSAAGCEILITTEAGYDEERWTLALLVVVVWGLNFVVIKLGLHNMPPLMLAGLRFMLVAFPALLFVARPAIPLRLLLGYGLTISFGQFAFCSALSAWHAGGAGVAGAAGASLYHHSWRLRLWRTLTGQAAGGDRAGDLRRAGAGGGEPRRGACPTGGLYADPGGGASAGLRQYFQQKIMSQATRPPIISLVVWSALIPVLPFMFASWLIDGPQLMLASLRQIDMLTVLSLLYLAFIATLVGYGIWGSLLGRYETWRVAPLSLLVPVVGMGQRCAAAGETLSGLQLAGAALIMAGLYINVFGLRLVRPGMARG